jgi:hypothetical protein
MKKVFWIIGLVIIILMAIVFVKMITNVGPGTAYNFNVVEGCEALKYYGPEVNISHSTELLDLIVIKHGYPARGLDKVTLREYCISENFNNNFEACFKENKFNIGMSCGIIYMS